MRLRLPAAENRNRWCALTLLLGLVFGPGSWRSRSQIIPAGSVAGNGGYGPQGNGGGQGAGMPVSNSGASISAGQGNPYEGSAVQEAAVPGVLALSLDRAMQMGLRHNLGLALSGEDLRAADGERLQALQGLLPLVSASAREAVQQTDLQAEGLRIPGFPAVIGPYGYTDIRGALQWSLLDLSALENYLASKHNFSGSKLSVEDAREMVVLTVGNAYLRCISDRSWITSEQAQVAAAKVSLDQAVANHQAGIAPLLDELRARVDYQTEQQGLLTAQNQDEKDKIALARAIGLSLEQKFELTDQAPYGALDLLDAKTAVQQAMAGRRDLLALEQQVEGAKRSRGAAAAERYPTVAFSGDYGDIGPTLGQSHGTFDVVGTAVVPVFEEGRLRGDARIAQSQLEMKEAELNDLRGQIDADVRDSLLDIHAAAKQVEVAHSSVQLAREALDEAQQRYAAGISDNLAVSEAQASMAQADDQYVLSLYRHNVAKLSLARALGVAQARYRNYVGGR